MTENKIYWVFRRGLFLAGVAVACATLKAQTYIYQLTIQPIQVGNGSGGLASLPSALDMQVAQKIWDQAGIFLNWLPATQFLDANFYQIGKNPSTGTFSAPWIASFTNLVGIPNGLSPGNP